MKLKQGTGDTMARLAAAIRGNRRKKPRGKPFPKGQLPPVGRQFQPGQSGNPTGRPKLTETHKEFRKACEDISIDLLDNAYVRAKVGRVSLAQVKLYEAIWDRAGHVVQKKVQLTGADGGPLKLEETGPGRSMLLKLAGEPELPDDEEPPEGGGQPPG